MTTLPPAMDAAALRTARLARLDGYRVLLERHGLTIGMIGRSPLIRHLCGAHDGVLTISGNDAWLVATDATAGIDEAAALGVETFLTPAYDADEMIDPNHALAARVADELRRHLPGVPIGAELAHLPAAALGVRAGEAIDIGPQLDAERTHKDDAELAAIRRAVAVVDRALDAAATVARAGVTESELHEEIARSLARDVGDDFALASNIASGGRTTESDPHATGRVIGPGDVVLLDLYPVVEGYVADLTRTWIIGDATPVLRRRHAALIAALEVGSSAAIPGIVGSAVDGVIRASLAASEGHLAQSMRHHGGHGLGLFAWERPWIGARSRDRLEHRAVICIEPGLYEAGVGGMRLEGQFLVGDSRPERLDRFTDDLLELPA
jgi:Xaa-Pro aminopeptidase